MLSSFKHKNNQVHRNMNLKTDMIAQALANKCIRAQYKLASVIQAKSEKLSLNTKRFIVIAFSAISFSCCVYLVVKSFLGNQDINISITPIKVPEQVVQNENSRVSQSTGVSKNEFEKVKKFRGYIDSLTASSSGRRIYDSIYKNRPGLIDSLAVIENIYKSQSPNK